MRLCDLHIESFRSLDSVNLNSLGQFNVLIGRNNSGKSTVFSFLHGLARDLAVQSGMTGIPWSGWSNVYPNSDATRVPKATLTFRLDDTERHELFSRSQPSFQPDRMAVMLGSTLLKSVTVTLEFDESKRQMILRRALAPAEDRILVALYSPEGIGRDPFNTYSESHTSDEIERYGHVQYYSAAGSPVDGVMQQGGTLSHILKMIVDFLYRSFFFQAIRKSSEQLAVSERKELATDGNDLAQLLHTIHSNASHAFREVESFVQQAIPEIGSLQTPLEGSMTYVAFRDSQSGFSNRLHEMGGGVEQLLLAAVALYTQPVVGALFLEEPESHLHPGAQRFLLTSLLNTPRQIFLTTHSSTFVNVRAEQIRIYRVTREQGRASIQPVGTSVRLAEALEDIGVRNSDVLLSDAVLFVEGPSDIDVLLALGAVLEIDLSGRNLRLLSTGGSADVQTSAPVRSRLLEDVMDQAAVPHLFLMDRDHRNETELEHLTRRLGGHLHVLARRELENYLLVPAAILKTLRELSPGNPVLLARLGGRSDEDIKTDIERIFNETADGLYGAVLIKRIRNELGGVLGGLLTREATAQLIPHAAHPDLDTQLTSAVQAHVAPLIDVARIQQVSQAQRARLSAEWQDVPSRLRITPGAELLDAVFSSFGVKFKKTSHGGRIARHMVQADIDPELQDFLRRAAALAPA